MITIRRKNKYFKDIRTLIKFKGDDDERRYGLTNIFVDTENIVASDRIALAVFPIKLLGDYFDPGCYNVTTDIDEIRFGSLKKDIKYPNYKNVINKHFRNTQIVVSFIKKVDKNMKGFLYRFGRISEKHKMPFLDYRYIQRLNIVNERYCVNFSDDNNTVKFINDHNLSIYIMPMRQEKEWV